MLSDYCKIAKPLGFNSKEDSKETIEEIITHNVKWECLCNKNLSSELKQRCSS